MASGLGLYKSSEALDKPRNKFVLWWGRKVTAGVGKEQKAGKS